MSHQIFRAVNAACCGNEDFTYVPTSIFDSNGHLTVLTFGTTHYHDILTASKKGPERSPKAHIFRCISPTLGGQIESGQSGLPQIWPVARSVRDPSAVQQFVRGVLYCLWVATGARVLCP
jgi:hypothetical protein